MIRSWLISAAIVAGLLSYPKWGGESPWSWTRHAQELEAPTVTQKMVAPGGVTATFNGTDRVTVSWGGVYPDDTTFSVWRNFGGDDELLTTTSQQTYVDLDPTLGSPAYYSVSADAPEMSDSDKGSAPEVWPMVVKTYRHPFYYLGQWGDYADSAMPQARIDSLAQFDAIGISPHYFEGSHEAGYTDYVERVRTAATALDGHDVIVLTYLFGNAARLDWAPAAVEHPTLVNPGTGTRWWGPYPAQYDRGVNAHTRIWDWCVANDAFLHDTSGNPTFNPAYPVYNYDYGNLTLAEKVAEFFVDSYEGSGADGEYTGVLYDFINADVQSWTADLGAIDLDQDGLAYNSSGAETAQEAGLYRAWHKHLVRSLRKEFGERGMDNRLIVVNGNGVQSSAYSSATYGDVSQWVDGWMEERWNDGTSGYPGSYSRFASSTVHQAAWNQVLTNYANPAKFTHSQVRPYPFMFHMYVNDSAPWDSLVPALAANGWAHGNDPSLNAGCGTSDACYTRGANGEKRISIPPTRLGTPGTIGQYTLLPSSSWPTYSDTLRVPTTNYVARMSLRPNGSTKASWPYIFIATNGDTLARGGGWPRKVPGAPAPPAEPLINNGGDILENAAEFELVGENFGSTQGSVKLGDADTYAACTVTVTQTPINSWSTTSVTFESNWGLLTVSAWLYVVDSNGVASNGWLVYLE